MTPPSETTSVTVEVEGEPALLVGSVPDAVDFEPPTVEVAAVLPPLLTVPPCPLSSKLLDSLVPHAQAKARTSAKGEEYRRTIRPRSDIKAS
jgi:hypothetical protein